MNHQSKQLQFNKSTLLSLKAELLKKQEEVKGKKQLPQNKVENYKAPAIARAAPSTNKADTFKEKLEKNVDADELEAQRRSVSALQRKAELYDHLSDGTGSSQLASRFLVDFRSKGEEEKKEERMTQKTRESSEERELGQEYSDDEDWVDFTDCLGRTRRCHKSDLEFYKKKDEKIMQSLGLGEEGNTKTERDKQSPDKNEPGPESPQKPLLVQQTDAYLQSLREKWEEKEKEMLARDSDIHYQDLLFDEARAHGVGYYNFSTEDSERRRQQQELSRARGETEAAREAAVARRAAQGAAAADRLAAARARQRQRAGLSAEDVNKDEFQLSSLLDFLTEQKNEAAKKAKEEEDKKREEREKERQKMREHYVREWDVGKDGTERTKEFRELTQEEYEEQQRSKRIEEFAPPQSNRSYSQTTNGFDEKGNFVNSHIPPPPVIKSWADVRPNTTESVNINDLPSSSKQVLYFSSKDNKKYSNSVQQDPVPIVNELEVVEKRKDVARKHSVAVEIEPPPTYDYYGPEVKRSRTLKGPDLRESYEQGLKFLQDIETKKNASKNLDFTL